jgi:hypothetical protein
MTFPRGQKKSDPMTLDQPTGGRVKIGSDDFVRRLSADVGGPQLISNLNARPAGPWRDGFAPRRGAGHGPMTQIDARGAISVRMRLVGARRQ